jgi:hypothetical protein
VALADLCSAIMEAPRFNNIMRQIEANELFTLDLRGNDGIEFFFF